ENAMLLEVQGRLEGVIRMENDPVEDRRLLIVLAEVLAVEFLRVQLGDLLLAAVKALEIDVQEGDEAIALELFDRAFDLGRGDRVLGPALEGRIAGEVAGAFAQGQR